MAAEARKPYFVFVLVLFFFLFFFSQITMIVSKANKHSTALVRTAAIYSGIFINNYCSHVYIVMISTISATPRAELSFYRGVQLMSSINPMHRFP